MAYTSRSGTNQQAAQQGAAPDRLQPTLVPRSGFRRRVSLVVVPARQLAGKRGIFILLPVRIGSTPGAINGNSIFVLRLKYLRSVRCGNGSTLPPALGCV